MTTGAGVECRSGGAAGNYQIILSFSNDLTNVDSVSVGCGSVSSIAFGPDPNQVTVNLTDQNACRQQYNTITLTNVDDVRGDHADTVQTPPWGLLIGDTNGNGVVNSADISQTKAQSGQPLTINNFRTDIVPNGSVSASDIALDKASSGHTLPSGAVSVNRN